MIPPNMKRLHEEVRNDLTQNILPFWMENCIEKKRDGFIGAMSNDLVVDAEAPKSLVVCARILWTFSAASRLLKDERYLPMAERARAYLLSHFLDNDYGGFYWWLDANGSPLEMDKKIYGQAFTIYAFAEHVRATGSEKSLKQARRMFELIESKSEDTEGVGYHDFCGRDWSLLGSYKLSDHGIPADKTYNTHLHLLEAYTNLYRIWPDHSLADRLKLLIEIHLDKIYDPKAEYMHLFFDRHWKPLSDEISYGHDIETSWLLCEGAEVLGDEALLTRVQDLAVKLADFVLKTGVDADGGMIYEENPRKVTDANKHWWPQAEAVVGFLNAWQLSGDSKFMDACLNSWSFIQNKIIDKEFGEWIWSVTRDGKVNENKPKVSPWKGPYHNSRMCFEVMKRIADE